MSKLKEYCFNITDGEHGSVTSSPDGKYFFLNNNNIREEGIVINSSDKKISRDEFERINRRIQLDNGDLVIATCGTLGKTYVIPPGNINYVFSRSVGIIKCNEKKLLPYYLHYYFLNPSVQKKIHVMAKGGIQKHFYIGDMMDFDVDFHDIQEQHQIVNVLRCLDEKIAVNRRITIELEALAKLIYDYWFLQFEFPNEDGKPYKSSGGKMIWNEELGREIPERWRVTKLGFLISSNRGISYTSQQILGSGIPMINLDSFNADSTYKPKGLKYYSGNYDLSKILRPYDLVMCNTQQTALDPTKDIIGKSFLIPDIFEGKNILSSHHVTTIRVVNGHLKYYLHRLFNTSFFHKYISGYATGTSILGLNFGGITEYLTEIPDANILTKYGELAQMIEERKSLILMENQELASLRDWLLPLLMNGQVGFHEEEDGQ